MGDEVVGGAVTDLTYSKDWQISLLQTLYRSIDLIKNVHGTMKSTDFDLPACQFVYETLDAYYDSTHKLPSQEIFVLEVERRIKQPDASKIQLLPEEYDSLGYVMERVCDPQAVVDHEYYEQQVVPFMRHVRAVKELQQYTQYGGSAGSVDAIVKRMSEITKLSGMADSLESTSMYENVQVAMTETDLAIRIGCGVSTLDSATKDGLPLGQLGLVVACPGVGKTNTLLNFSRGAVWQGQRVLILTLEMSPVRVKQRSAAMAACISANLFDQPITKWPKHSRAAFEFITSPEFPYRGHTQIVDMSQHQFTLSQVDSAVERWKVRTEKEYGAIEAAKCTAIYLDWFDLLVPDKVSKDDPEHKYLPRMFYEAARIAKRYQVVFWTAAQGTREADGKERLRMGDVASAYHKNDALDLSIGVAPLNIQDNAPQTTEIHKVTKSGIGEKRVQVDCNQSLNYTITKGRDLAKTTTKLYLGPPLRLFNSSAEWVTAHKAIEAGDFRIIMQP